MKSLHEADSFSLLERRFVPRARQFLYTMLSPLVWLLARLHVPPNLVSVSQVLLALVIFVLVPSQPKAAFILFLTTLILDTLDGALARRSRGPSPFGALLDQFCDHARETLVIAALAYYGALQVPLAVLYPFVYLTFNLTLYLANYFRAPIPFAIKSYLVVYPAIFAYLWFGLNVLDAALLLSILLMLLVISLGFHNLRRALG